ncbi:MAG: DUF1643 domain-containing protein, partial [Flavobacteriaceae bacterium]
LIISAEFSDCGKYRYLLSAINPECKGSKTLSVIMQNPSEADETKADKSVQFLENLVFGKNYEAFRGVKKMIIVNQFAFIQTKGFIGTDERIGPRNDDTIRKAMWDSDIILIAWGKNNPYKDRQEEIMKFIWQCPDKIVLKTRKHPSRGFYTDFIRPMTLNNSID